MANEVMNETIKNLETRRSCRSFKPEMPPKELIDKVIEAGTYAATGKGMQRPIIIAVTDKEMRDKLSQVNRSFKTNWPENFDPFYGGPVVLIVLADKTVPTYVYDGSLVMGNLLNAATSLGLGNIWIHRAKETFETEFGKQLLKDLGIEGEYEGIGNCVLGYEAQPPKAAAPRKKDYVYYID